MAETADATGATSVHIWVAGAKGSSLECTYIGRPCRTTSGSAVDEMPSLKPFMNHLIDSRHSTVFDLCSMRAAWASFGNMDTETNWIVFGYDFSSSRRNSLRQSQFPLRDFERR